MTRASHLSIAMLSGLLCLAFQTGRHTCSAGEYKVINQSDEPVYVVVHHWVVTSGGGLGGATQFGVDDSADYWKTHGWQVVKPRQSRIVYDGPRDRIYIRMTRGTGLTGEVIKPSTHFGHTSQLVHGNVFTIRRDDDREENRRYQFEAGAGSMKAKFTGSKSQLQKICKSVNGFYFVDSHTDFTVQPRRPTVPPAPPQPAPPAAALWRGVYHSQYGRLELVANGNTLDGYMNYPNGGSGRLRGQVVGDRLRFDWWHAQDRGHGELFLQPGGRQLRGWFVSREGRKTWNLSR